MTEDHLPDPHHDVEKEPGGLLWERDDAVFRDWFEALLFNLDIEPGRLDLDSFATGFAMVDEKEREIIFQRLERARAVPEWLNAIIEEGHKALNPNAFDNFVNSLNLDFDDTSVEESAMGSDTKPPSVKEQLIERLADMAGKEVLPPTVEYQTQRHFWERQHRQTPEDRQRRQDYLENREQKHTVNFLFNGATVLLGGIITATGLFRMAHRESESPDEHATHRGGLGSILTGIITAGFGALNLYAQLQEPEGAAASRALLSRFGLGGGRERA